MVSNFSKLGVKALQSAAFDSDAAVTSATYTAEPPVEPFCSTEIAQVEPRPQSFKAARDVATQASSIPLDNATVLSVKPVVGSE